MTTPTPSSVLAALRISGHDAATFLQSQLSCNVDDLASRPVVDGAWLSPAGRVVCVVQLVAVDGEIAVFLPADLVDAVATRLNRFRLRADVSLNTEAGWGAASDTGRSDVLARRALPGTAVTECYTRTPTRPDDAWRAARIAAGYPWIDLASSEVYTAHQLNLDRLGAVRLDKGCYSGQEIVARTTHRGRVKRRAARFTLPAGATPRHGDPITNGAGDKLGDVICSASAGDDAPVELLALLPVDAAQSLAWHDMPLEPKPLPFDVAA